MKKVFLSFAVLLMGCALFTACGDDDDDNDKRPANPQDSQVTPAPKDSTNNVTPAPKDSTNNVTPDQAVAGNGVFVVGAGNSMSNIVGALTYFDVATGKTTANIFKQVNGRELGVTANDGMVYGSKLYVVVDGENTIEVMDARTLKSVKQISTTTLLGEQEGKSPRRIVAKDGHIFVSTFGGYVAVIDTVNYALTTKLQAGSYPEGMAFSGKMLFVANSDYGKGTNPSISIFSTDLQNKAFRKIIDLKDSLINNPTILVANGYDLYILCGDTYDPVNYSVKQKGGLRKYASGNQSPGSIANIAENVSMMAANGTNLYLILDAYVQPQYKVLDMSSDQLSSLDINNGVDVPNAIGVDPVTGDFVVAGYRKNPETGYGDYSAAGKAIRYSSTGSKTAEFETAVGPSAVFFSNK